MGPNWMDELSGSKNCVDDPDFMQAQMGKYQSLPTQLPKGDSHVKNPRMGVKEGNQLPGEAPRDCLGK